MSTLYQASGWIANEAILNAFVVYDRLIRAARTATGPYTADDIP